MSLLNVQASPVLAQATEAVNCVPVWPAARCLTLPGHLFLPLLQRLSAGMSVEAKRPPTDHTCAAPIASCLIYQDVHLQQMLLLLGQRHH